MVQPATASGYRRRLHHRSDRYVYRYVKDRVTYLCTKSLEFRYSMMSLFLLFYY